MKLKINFDMIINVCGSSTDNNFKEDNFKSYGQVSNSMSFEILNYKSNELMSTGHTFIDVII